MAGQEDEHVVLQRELVEKRQNVLGVTDPRTLTSMIDNDYSIDLSYITLSNSRYNVVL